MKALPGGKLLFDTSAYIRYLRDGAFLWISEDRNVIQRSILTVVVAAELYTGARYPEERDRLDRLCRGYRALGALSSPDADCWLQAGLLLGRYARLYGSVRMADHFRDVLIALETIKHRATLVTENALDFARWKKLLRSTRRDLRVFDLRTLSRT